MVPAYKEGSSFSLEEQARYHAEWWGLSTQEGLSITAEECRGIVHFYRDVLPVPSEPHRILEIGSGRGSLLEALRREGYVAIGCEPSGSLREIAIKSYGLSPAAISQQDALTFLRSQDTQVNAVFAWHVIEHIHLAFEVLEAAKATLLPDGLIIGQVPQLHKWHLFPQHLFLLSRRTIYRIAARLDLKVCSIGLSPREQFLSFALCGRESRWPEWTYDPDDFWTDFLRDQMRAIQALAQGV